MSRGRPNRANTVIVAVAATMFAGFAGACASYKVAVPDGGTGGAAGASNGAGGGAGGVVDASDAGGGSDRDAGRALGATCSGDGDCASGHCAGTLCCDQACTGPCAQCSSSGACQMPADDPACGTIACPADTTCRDWATGITANRCKAIGQCKGAADCGFVDAPQKTYCGLYQGLADRAQVCDGGGKCVGPTVKCGGDLACSTNPGVCCFSGTAGTACFAQEDQCSPSSTGYSALCDDATDCPPGAVCCYSGGPGGQGINCTASCVPFGTGFAIQVCNPTLSGECRSGTCQGTTTALPPYFTCR
jgi:hypothetical protein